MHGRRMYDEESIDKANLLYLGVQGMDLYEILRRCLTGKSKSHFQMTMKSMFRNLYTVFSNVND